MELPAGWETPPPVHHTESNCWNCGRFSSMEQLTKGEQERGWQVAEDGTVTCGDECRVSL